MRFQVGPWEYRVEISDGALYDDDGAECAGLCIWMDHVVKISSRIPPARRLDVLLHELRHAWQHHMGSATSAEDDANSTSTFAAMCVHHLIEQGGEAKLMEMQAARADAAPARAAHSTMRTFAQGGSPDGGTECGSCGRRFSAGEIVTGAAEFNAITGKTLIPRGVYCDGCHHVQEWREAALDDGTPSGAIVGKLMCLRGVHASEWLAIHGEQVGVFVA